jgi:hypothetical protein
MRRDTKPVHRRKRHKTTNQQKKTTSEQQAKLLNNKLSGHVNRLTTTKRLPSKYRLNLRLS